MIVINNIISISNNTNYLLYDCIFWEDQIPDCKNLK